MRYVTFGEIMLRLTPSHEKVFLQSDNFDVSYAGSEANVAVTLAHFNQDVEFISALPNNPIAERCIMDLRSHNVGIEETVRSGKRMGILYSEIGSNMRPTRVYYDREDSSMATIDNDSIDWSQIFEDNPWFHWSGITPAISESAYNAILGAINVAKSKGCPISCDINYRSNLWNYGKKASELIPNLMKQCDYILGSVSDYNEVLGLTGNCDNWLDLLNEAFPNVKAFVIIQRDSVNSNSAVWYSTILSKSQVMHSRQYQLTDIVDSIGAGDAYVGAFIYAINELGDIHQAMEFATAAGCLKHTYKGDYNWCEKAEVEQLLKGNNDDIKR